MKRIKLFALSAVLGGSLLSACAPLMVGSFVGTVLVASDRRTAGIQLEDETIERKASSAMSENFGSKVHVNINSFNRQVLLTGEVPSDVERAQVEQLVGKIANVRAVVNELGIGPASSFGDRSADTLLTTRVKASLVDSNDIFASSFYIVTERKTVYLMGRVTQREAARATDVVRGVSGVKRVVRVFDYITEEELKQLQPEKPKPEPTKSTPVTTGNGTPLTTQQPLDK
jgi:osmotically-inducible protein OsmY